MNNIGIMSSLLNSLEKSEEDLFNIINNFSALVNIGYNLLPSTNLSNDIDQIELSNNQMALRTVSHKIKEDLKSLYQRLGEDIQRMPKESPNLPKDEDFENSLLQLANISLKSQIAEIENSIKTK